jgi:hypothetical protein
LIADDGDQYLMSGLHLVNRIGFLVSTIAISQGTDVEIHISMLTEPGDESGDRETAR